MGYYKKQMKTIIYAAGMALLTGLAGMSGSVMASTPDGETPANEGVCDVLHGGTPGLYGLCVAYCEAQDLDSFDKEPPNIKILENYNKKMKAGDPGMPCVKDPCPCWTDAELASVSADGDASCTNNIDKIQIINTNVLVENRTHFADATIKTGREQCRYINLNSSPRTVRSQSVSPAGAQVCFSLIQQQAACN